jgi:hypothetical protein
MSAVTLAASILLVNSCLLAQVAVPQYGHKPAPDKGPRALAVIQLSPKGKARIIPITIMMDGKFYDAGSYKAAPVPMALDFGIVYEGFRTGVSQGVFTITQPGQLNHVWIAEGTWLPAGEKAPEKNKKYSAPVIEDIDAPPVLHRRSENAGSESGSDNKDKGKDKDENKDKDKEKEKNKNKDQQTTPAASPPPASVPSAGAPSTPSTPDAAKTPAPADAKTSASRPDEPIEDPHRPRLRRGKPDTTEHHEPFTTFDDATPSKSTTGNPAATAKDAAAALPQVTVIPAISDAGGPDPRPYTYDLKPAEEAIYRNKMLDLAASQITAQAVIAAKDTTPRPNRPTTGKSIAKPAKPLFDELRLRIFDLSNSNEPVLVLSAKTHPPAGSSEDPKEITLIARTNLEGELRKLFFAQTDSRHLDVSPRMELVDAVDADGDGRGELLFRRTSDGGSAYAIYRVTADRLWPLFEGTP